MKQYRVTLKHDAGRVTIRTAASDERQAVAQVLAAETAPECAVIRVTEVRPKGPYQPKTGQPCGCRRGIERDNCPSCEGTGWVIDFQAIRNRTQQ